MYALRCRCLWAFFQQSDQSILYYTREERVLFRYGFSELAFRSMTMEMVKIVRYVRCGMRRARGTYKGKLKTAGNSTVANGMINSRLD